MINKELVIKLADFLILNAYSVRNIGLYNGKIGLALCLFELADYLKEENIEEHAFEILQESLALSKKKIDISFNNGLSGIGFSLFYLIKNQLLDADFNELFEQQTHTVLKQIKILSDLNPYECFPILCFLYLLSQMDEKKDIEELIKVILAQSSERLEQDLSDFESLHSKLTKHQVLKTFNDYLRILFIHKYPISYPLIQRYGKFSKQGRAGSDFEVAFYLKRMCSNLKDPSVTGNLEIQEERALRNLKINHELLTLSERIHILFLMNQDTIKYSSYIELLEKGLFEIAPEEFEKKLLQGIPSGKYIPGYEFGIARYLIYFVYKNLKDEGKDVSRFNRLFL